MSSIRCPAILISAPASGQGKTLTAATLCRAWSKQGLKVQAFKTGPDFLDSMILEVGSGRPVYNLDLGMCGLEDAKARLFQAATSADVIVIEGVMGLFDGNPSTADLALAFDIPVLLTIDASGMGQTFGAMATGLLEYKKELNIAGVLANKIGSPGHATLLKHSLPEHIPWFGALEKNNHFLIPERHLGLHTAQEVSDLHAKLELAANSLVDSLGEQKTLALPPSIEFNPPTDLSIPALLLGKTIAIARDEAFCFIYQANLDCLQQLGANLVFFSPLHDDALPEAQAYWLPGGYPELHLDKISLNKNMSKSLKTAAEKGIPILAECGGMMALTESINNQAAFGLLPGKVEMQNKLQGIGTQFLLLPATQGCAEATIYGHIFHYSKFETRMIPIASAVTQRQSAGEWIYKQDNILASYMHFYFPSNPVVTASFFTKNDDQVVL